MKRKKEKRKKERIDPLYDYFFNKVNSGFL